MTEQDQPEGCTETTSEGKACMLTDQHVGDHVTSLGHRWRDVRSGEFIRESDAESDPGHTVAEALGAQPDPADMTKARNLAQFLTEQLGVRVEAIAYHGHALLSIDLDTARAAYEADVALFERLSPNVAGPLWTMPR